MGDASQEPGQRMRGLAEAASDFKVDNRIPIRRYFRYTTDTNTCPLLGFGFFTTVISDRDKR